MLNNPKLQKLFSECENDFYKLGALDALELSTEAELKTANTKAKLSEKNFNEAVNKLIEDNEKYKLALAEIIEADQNGLENITEIAEEALGESN